MNSAMGVLVRFSALALAVLALAACGSDDGGDSGATATAAGTETIEISATDFAFDPPTIELEAAGEYTFRLTNDGQSPHALEIDGEGIEEETQTIGPGETAELAIELAEGEYEMYCPVGDHRDRGMEGVVRVGAAGGGGAGTTTDGDGTTTGDDGGTTTDGEDDSGGYNY
jgi:plastocyanin